MLTLCLAVCLSQAEPPAELIPAPAPMEKSGPSVSSEQMRAALHTYVRGERFSSIPFWGSGLATGIAGGLMFTSASNVARGAGYPLLTFAAFEVLAGFIFFGRSFGLERRLDAELTDDPALFVTHETAHASRIVHTFQPLLLAFEGAVTATGGVLAGVGGAQHNDTLAGVGLGLAVQGLVFFLLDWAVLDRAQAYESAVEHFAP